jgi:hypothetical protein
MRGLWMFGIGLTSLVAIVAYYTFIAYVTMWALVVPAFVLSNGLRKLVGASRDLRAHDEAHPPLPRATVVKQLE